MKQLNSLIFLLSCCLIFMAAPQQLNAYAAGGHILSNTAVEQAPPVEKKKAKKKKKQKVKKLRLKKKLFQKKPNRTQDGEFIFVILIWTAILAVFVGTGLTIAGGFIGGWNPLVIAGVVLLAISFLASLIVFIAGLNAGGWGAFGGWIFMLITAALHFIAGIILLIIGLILLNPILWITSIILMLELIVLILALVVSV